MKGVLGVMAMLAGMLMLLYDAVYLLLGWAMVSGGPFSGNLWGLALWFLIAVGGVALCFAGISALKNG